MHKLVYFFLITLSVFKLSFSQSPDLPNILWIVSEDNSPIAGIYGDEIATTPNIDRLGQEGFVYTNAHANAPVCAPARNTIITGVYANSNGNQHMRSFYEVSGVIEFFPVLLRETGYYTTNNPKEDYNIAEHQTRDIWDESSNQAHYNNRGEGQPFFAVFNSNLSHEHKIHTRIPVNELRHKPDEVTIPPYLPDTPDIRHDIAQYYDHLEEMDTWVGEILQDLEDSGEAENTIVFYYGDHGGVYPRSKRFVYDTGTRVPLIVRIPERFRDLWPADHPDSKVERPVSFVDLAPTLLSISGIPIPDFMQGKSFLGDQKTPDPEYVFMFRDRMDERYDMSRAVRSERYRYIRNYMPYRIYGQRLDYLWRAPSMGSWEQTCKVGGCNEIQNKFWNPKPVEELYDTQNDPWEVNNLAGDPDYNQILEQMRKANKKWMVNIHDSGFLPEAEMIDRPGDQPVYDYLRKSDVSLSRIIEVAEKAIMATDQDVEILVSYLSSEDSAIRYWAATGLLILDEHARSAIDELKAALKDSSTSVRTVVSESLYNLGEKNLARSGFLDALKTPNEFARTHVLNVIDSVDEDSAQIQNGVIQMAQQAGTLTRQHYDHRAAKVLMDKWRIDPEKYDIVVDW
ncbi:MAG: sulfatase-like hydrolase/transferase [Balneolaceae bacterium]|nr:sulfatase-like hydrolase/transferase [Balneolaceae bacterium]